MDDKTIDALENFFKEKSLEHHVNSQELLIDYSYGSIRLLRYNEGANEKWKLLETIKTS